MPKSAIQTAPHMSSSEMAAPASMLPESAFRSPVIQPVSNALRKMAGSNCLGCNWTFFCHLYSRRRLYTAFWVCAANNLIGGSHSATVLAQGVAPPPVNKLIDSSRQSQGGTVHKQQHRAAMVGVDSPHGPQNAQGACRAGLCRGSFLWRRRRPPSTRRLSLNPHFLCQADDPELEAIRQRRMAQMMAQQGGGGGPGGKAPASAEEMEAQAEQREAAEEQRRAMLMNIMQPQARDRREQRCWRRNERLPARLPGRQAAYLPVCLPALCE